MKTRTVTLMILVLTIGTLFNPVQARAAREEQEISRSVISVIDSRNKVITLTHQPERIISLSPNITETIFALGAEQYLKGRTDYCDYPEQARIIPSMGDLLTPSVERIIAAAPDVVIISNLGQLQTIESIELAGIPVAFLDEPETMDGTFRIIEKVGVLTTRQTEASQLIAEMKEQLNQITQQNAGRRPTVYYAAGFGEWGDFTATGDTFIHDIITLAGGDNIASDARNWTFQLELIHAYDPDIIILPALWGSTYAQTYHQFTTHPSYKSLTAVTNDAIVTIESNMIERQGPRSAEAGLLLAEQFAKVKDRWQ